MPYCLIAALAACSSVPGETLTSGARQREVRDRVLSQTSKDSPPCTSRRIVDTEILELHPDAKVAVERWTVDECGRRVNYRVNFPAKGKGVGFLVRPE